MGEVGPGHRPSRREGRLGRFPSFFRPFAEARRPVPPGIRLGLLEVTEILGNVPDEPEEDVHRGTLNESVGLPAGDGVGPELEKICELGLGEREPLAESLDLRGREESVLLPVAFVSLEPELLRCFEADEAFVTGGTTAVRDTTDGNFLGVDPDGEAGPTPLHGLPAGRTGVGWNGGRVLARLHWRETATARTASAVEGKTWPGGLLPSQAG